MPRWFRFCGEFFEGETEMRRGGDGTKDLDANWGVREETRMGVAGFDTALWEIGYTVGSGY